MARSGGEMCGKRVSRTQMQSGSCRESGSSGRYREESLVKVLARKAVSQVARGPGGSAVTKGFVRFLKVVDAREWGVVMSIGFGLVSGE
jgi:hypothetical protein